MSGPLKGLTVVEMAGIGPGPLTGQLLGDLGADVIVIDRTSRPADPTDINNRSKRSIALNLKHPAGIEAALKLIDKADILIEGFRPGVMEKLGLGPDVCLARNPRLVFGRMTGWGQTGPLAKWAGHDINYLAITGGLLMMGPKGKPPIPPLNVVADYGGGTMFLIMGILSAIIERQTSGAGQVIDAAMVDGVPAIMGLMHMFHARGEWSFERESNLNDGGSPFYRCYLTADNQYLSVGPLEPHFFAIVIEKAGLPKSHHPDQYEKSTWPERHKIYEDIFIKKTRAEWEAIFANSDGCVAPVLSLDEVEAHPHNAARKSFMRVDGVLQAAPAPRFSRSVPATPKAPVAPGSDTQAVLKDFGYSSEELARLKAEGVLT